MIYENDKIYFENIEELKPFLTCKCGNPFDRDKGFRTKCKKQWYYFKYESTNKNRKKSNAKNEKNL